MYVLVLSCAFAVWLVRAFVRRAACEGSVRGGECGYVVLSASFSSRFVSASALIE